MNANSSELDQKRRAFEEEQRAVTTSDSAIAFLERYHCKVKRDKQTASIRITYPDENFEVVDNEVALVEAARRWPAPLSEFNQSAFSKFVGGRYGLAKTFWVFNFLVNIAGVILMSVFMASGLEPFAAILGLAFMVYTPLCLAAIWNAAGLYNGIPGMGVLARIVVVLGAFQYVATCATLSRAL